MKNSLSSSLFKGTILNSSKGLEKLARKSGWLQRTPKKITPIHFIHGFLYAVSAGEPSFRLLAIAIGMRLTNQSSSFSSSSQGSGGDYDTISKQALWDRVDESAVKFFKVTLEELLSSKNFSSGPIPALPGVHRILIEDSSKIDLPSNLSDKFPATKNQHGHEGAGLRLQGVFDLISGEALRLELTDYYRQDTVASKDILPLLSPGDLVIRDLGYMVSEALRGIMEKKAHFLSRYKIGRPVYLAEPGSRREKEVLKLHKYLKKHAPHRGDRIDLDILLGSPDNPKSQQVKCRLVAVRLPEEAVEKRLRKIRAEENRRGIQKSEELKALLGWTILLTSLPREEATVELLLDLYPLRWRVEIIFKSLKSYTPGQKLAAHRSNANHIQALLHAWLCLTVAATKMGVFALCKRGPGKDSKLQPNLLSLLKVLPKVFEMFRIALFFGSATTGEHLLGKWMAQSNYHDKYERRNHRRNMAVMTCEALGDAGSSLGSAPLSLALT